VELYVIVSLHIVANYFINQLNTLPISYSKLIMIFNCPYYSPKIKEKWVFIGAI